MADLRYLLLLTFVLTGCAAQGPAANPLASTPQETNQLQLQQLQQDQQALVRQVSTLEEQVRRLEVQLQAQQAVYANLSSHPTEKVMGGGQKAETSTMSAELKGQGAPSQTATDIYLKAFSDYASGRFSEAMEGFRLFLERYPENDFSGNAQFWLGECYYSQRLLSRALAEFAQVAERYPTGAKAPDALLRMVGIYTELNQPENKRQTEDQLLESYPQSRAVKKLRAQGSN